ncbi:MAG: NUDIX domain-containing protein [Deltaproteobacteria bacterium]|nr:NUDIX domain-containing protein [Deltaproteobacteria bacterium]
MRKEKRFCPLCGGNLEKIPLDGRIRLFCKECKNPVYENPVPATAAVVLNGEDHLLLVKRGMEPAKGAWCLPGGFVELDETPSHGAKRELQEETGLVGEVERLIDVVYEDSPFHGPLIIIGYHIIPCGGVLQAGDDAADAQYFSFTALPEVAFNSHQTIINKIARRNT